MKSVIVNNKKLIQSEIDSTILNLRSKNNLDVAIALLTKVNILSDTNCWIINKDWSHYAVFDCIMAHRLSYSLFIGDIISGRYICHRCDRKGCINPKHLFQGTSSDNHRDWKNKNKNYIVQRKRDILSYRDLSYGEAHNPKKVIEPWWKL